jgi:hypothetical protein
MLIEGGVPHVVRIRLEGEAEQGDGLAARLVAERLDHLAAHRPLALIVHLDHRLHDPQRRGIVLRRLEQGDRVLWESMNRRNPGRRGGTWRRCDCRARSRGQRPDVGADHLAQIGHLVDEGDLGRRERHSPHI